MHWQVADRPRFRRFRRIGPHSAREKPPWFRQDGYAIENPNTSFHPKSPTRGLKGPGPGAAIQIPAASARAVDIPKAVLFDIDGTILDANLSIRDTMNRVLLERGQPTFTKAELDRLIGNPLRMILAEKCKDPKVVEEMVPRYRMAYGESGWLLADLFPGVHDLLVRLRGRGVATGIVSSKGQRESEVLLSDLGIAGLFDCVVGDDDVRPLKPDPAPVAHGCALLGMGPAETVMVGDTRFDILSAKAAGLQAIGVLWGNGSQAELVAVGADQVARDVDGLRRILGA